MIETDNEIREEGKTMELNQKLNHDKIAELEVWARRELKNLLATKLTKIDIKTVL